jgi:preprotein translocase subunit SecE
MGVRIPPGLPDFVEQNLSRTCGMQVQGSRIKEYKGCMFAKISKFINEVTVELKKVSWPTKNELIGSTVVVIISVAAMTLFIGICDFVFSKAVHMIIK